MATPLPTSMPASFIQGETVQYRRSYPDFPATLWNLQVSLAGAGQITVTAAADTNGVDFVVTIPVSASKDQVPGGYRWQELAIEKSLSAGETEKQQRLLDNGVVAIEPNLAFAAGGSAQTKNELILAALYALFLGKLTADQETIQIDGTAISRIPSNQVEPLIRKYEELVWNERYPNAAFGSAEFNFGGPRLLTLPGLPTVPWP